MPETRPPPGRLKISEEGDEWNGTTVGYLSGVGMLVGRLVADKHTDQSRASKRSVGSRRPEVTVAGHSEDQPGEMDRSPRLARDFKAQEDPYSSQRQWAISPE